MVDLALDRTARRVLERYPLELSSASWTSLGNAGGFSGARLWRGVTLADEQLCLRAWPYARMTDVKLNQIQRAMSVSRLPIVPELWGTSDDETWVMADDRYWEITTWLPGTADFHQNPSDERLFAAMRALAAIHERWLPPQPLTAPCPAVRRIIKALRSWRELVQTGWQPDFDLPLTPEIHAVARQAWEAIFANIFATEFALHEWENRPMPVQVCLCDVWHDHILYVGDEVTGVIDYGGVKPDCVALDLARLLGSMAPDQTERTDAALAVYTALHPVPAEVLKLVPVLDRCGAVVGLTNWIRWLYLDRRSYDDLPRVTERLEKLLGRVATTGKTKLFAWA